jgi:hypothetical protein
MRKIGLGAGAARLCVGAGRNCLADVSESASPGLVHERVRATTTWTILVIHALHTPHASQTPQECTSCLKLLRSVQAIPLDAPLPPSAPLLDLTARGLAFPMRPLIPNREDCTSSRRRQDVVE